ncbi:MAG: metallophosphoesterase [Clostridia bacterium]|nr:metallophosphoesterase [Clostridia bacterium]
MKLKVIHTADIHFDTAFSGLSDAKKASVRRQDLRNTFSKICALAKNADMLIISGDLFDAKSVSQTTLDFLKNEFSNLGDTRVFISAGNHDYLGTNSVYKTFNFGPNVYIFGTEPEVVETEYADIYGVSFKTANDNRNLLPEFEIKNPDKINLLVMHANLGGENYNPVKPADIENSGMDYVALGHIHARSELKKRGSTFFAYPGCPEGRGFDETDEKGVLALEIDKIGVDAKFIPTQERKYLIFEIDVSRKASHEEIIDEIKNKSQDNKNIYRFILTGEYEFPIDCRIIEDALDAFECTVVDKTSPKEDLSRLSGEFSLKGLFTRFAIEDKDDLDDEEFKTALKTGFSFIEKEERNENR